MTEENTIKTSPTRPYITRALFEWIEDNNLTPYLHVDATFNHVMVPTEHVKDGQIVLNISSSATHQLIMSNDAIQFSARFGGVSRNLFIPFQAVMGIYAKEDGQGMFFDPSEYSDYSEAELEAFSELANEPLAMNREINDAKSEQQAKEQADADKQARIEKAKKSGFRVIE